LLYCTDEAEGEADDISLSLRGAISCGALAIIIIAASAQVIKIQSKF